jgi:FkbM family methyltransferase
LVRRLEPAAERLGTWVLGSPPLRRALNAAYESASPVFASPVTRFFTRSTVTLAFVWRARLPTGILLVPVVPELQRSWADALVWRWPRNLHMRHLYEAYTSCRETDGVLLDVGANDGLHSCLFALAGWRCIAFEPQPGCVAYMHRIAALNRFSELAVEQFAVGDTYAEAVDFYVSESSWYSSFERGQVERHEAPERISVGIVTLDGYCQEHNVDPTCVKIDVEGHELPVLRGAARVLDQSKPDLVIEVSADPAIREGMWDLLTPLGYRAYVVARTGLRALPTPDMFCAAGPGADGVDALFTADQKLGQQLEAMLSNRQ